MKKNIIYIIIFLFTFFIFTTCLFNYFFSFFYTTKEGDDYYHSKVSEHILIFNYGKNIKSVKYCFTNTEKCNDYLNYDGDLTKRIINISIDYPDNNNGSRICIKINSNNSSRIRCNSSKYVVDSLNPVITSLYNEIILSDNNQKLEDLFKVSSNTGIKDFNCEYTNKSEKESSVVKCKAIGNNNLESVYTQKIYINNSNKLEGKKILFVGDSITEANRNLDDFKGWAGRIGLRNYMDWYNVGVGGATIAKTDNHITNQIIDNKDNNYDYILLQGGINDMNKAIVLGEISDSFDVEDFDNSTFAGGLEELFYYTKKYNPDSKIGFIITYQTPNSNWSDDVRDRSKQAKLQREICDKWKIPYLDLYDGIVYEDSESKTYSQILKVDKGEHFYNKDPEDVHLSSSGYDIVSKYIDVFIKTL